jgi:hypothetical protein
MDFKVYGPFTMPRNRRGLITTDADEKRCFWQEIDEMVDGLSDACGCFIFAISPSGGGTKPWYVGQTCRQGFRSECFQPHKINLYNNAIAEYERATPLLFLLAKLTPSNQAFAKPSSNGHADIEALEDVLIGIAYSRNRNLLNIRGTSFLRDAIIPGVMNSPPGNPGASALELKRLLGLDE